ncbi:MAG: hypothetical protein Q9M31_05075, partial [Mariprofundus sp.]|nr:hypothetical protein [Mariprofundus sp.]
SCLNTQGEGLLIHGDRGSARLEALAQAKWLAIEQAIGVHIKSKDLVSNFELIDSTIIKKTDGIIKSYKILQEKEDGEIYRVKIHVCVERAKAEEAVNKLARNTTVATLIVSSSKKIISQGESEHGSYRHYREKHSEENPLTSSLNELLIQQGVEVVSLENGFKGDFAKLDRAMARGNYSQVSRMLSQSLSNVVITGHVTNDISTEKGSDIGYGISMPLYRVTAYLSYSILNKAGDGRVNILKAGKAKAVGMGTALETANQIAMENLAEQVTEEMANGVMDHIYGLSRQIDIQVKGIPNADRDQVIQEQIQRNPWVMELTALGLGHYKVRYPEKTPYLANTLSRIDGMRVNDYSSLAIKAKYQAR